MNGAYGFGNEKRSWLWITAESKSCPAMLARAYMSASSGPGSPRSVPFIDVTWSRTNCVDCWMSRLDSTGNVSPTGSEKPTVRIALSAKERKRVLPARK